MIRGYRTRMNRSHECKERECWEPVDQLEARAMDNMGEIIYDDPERPQRYHSVVIGFALGDDGGYSVAEVITGEGREKDMKLARLMIESLKHSSKGRR